MFHYIYSQYFCFFFGAIISKWYFENFIFRLFADCVCVCVCVYFIDFVFCAHAKITY